MYEFVDRPVDSLNRGGRFLIWVMRSWVETLGKGNCPSGSVEPVFRKWEIMAGYPHFHVMMALFNRHATEHFRFGSVSHKRITEHEALIIGMIRAARVGPTEEMRKAAGLMVCEDSVSHLLIAMSELGDALLHAQLWPVPPLLNQDNVSFRYE